MKHCLLPIALLLFTSLPTLRAQLIDNFESGVLSDWTILDGAAAVANTQVFGGNASLEMGVSPDGPTLLTHNTFSEEHGRFRVHFYCEGLVSDFNFIFQYQGPDAYYEVICRPQGTDNPELRLVKVVDGVLENLGVVNAAFGVAEWHELTVERRCNGDILVFVNGLLSIEVNDQDIQGPGKVGLGAWAQFVYADNLSFDRFSAEVKIEGDPLFCYDAIRLEASGNFSEYLWSTGSFKKSIDIDEEGLLWVEATDANGCKARDSVMVLSFCPTLFYAPNIFSPNFDGVNDAFQIFPQRTVTQYRLQVFNRWGELMFDTQNLEEGWDGTFRGKTAPQDMYIWTANLDGFALTGNVLLMR